MAVRRADGIMFTDMPLSYIDSLVGLVRTELENTKRDAKSFRVSNWFVWNVQETDEEALRIARHHLPFRLYYIRDVASAIGLDSTVARELETMQPRMIRAFFKKENFELPPENVTKFLVEHLTITGSKKNLGPCIERLHTFEKKGLNEIALALEGDLVASIKLLGKRGVPLLNN